jgi:ubiquinone/menaquinone biosynthesis C-methylase UbiE
MNQFAEINKRYSELSETECCLSCGNAINLAVAKKGEVCVDLGCGKGTDVIRLAEIVGAEGFVYGIDISDGMLEKAQKNAEKFNVKNVSFIKTDLENIKINDSKVDLIISNCTINHASDKDIVWKEMYRILKPGGRVVVSDIYSSAEVPAEYKNDPVAISECWGGSVTKDTYIQTIKNSGLINFTLLEESKPYPKGKIEVSSFTVFASKPEKKKSCCCCN